MTADMRAQMLSAIQGTPPQIMVQTALYIAQTAPQYLVIQ